MNSPIVFSIVIGIGIVAGLRAMTAPAIVCWAAHLGWISLSGSPLAFMGSKTAVAIFSLLALVEFVTDQLPKTPSRTVPVQLGARIIMGGLAGACLSVAASQSLVLGALLGAVGALIGTFGGYQARMRLVRALNVKDAVVATLEDLVAIGLALFLVSRQ